MNNNELTLEELMAEYEMLGEKIKQKKQDDENRKKAELELNKQKRKKEVDDAGELFYKLLRDYIKDYGAYEIKCTAKEFPTVINKLFDYFNF